MKNLISTLKSEIECCYRRLACCVFLFVYQRVLDACWHFSSFKNIKISVNQTVFRLFSWLEKLETGIKITQKCLCNDRYQFTRAQHKCKHNEQNKQEKTASEQKHAETSRGGAKREFCSFSVHCNAAENARDENREKKTVIKLNCSLLAYRGAEDCTLNDVTNNLKSRHWVFSESGSTKSSDDPELIFLMFFFSILKHYRTWLYAMRFRCEACIF